MTRREAKSGVDDLKALLARDADYLRAMVQSIVQATLEAEMTEAIGAEKGERTETRLCGVKGKLAQDHRRRTAI